MMAETSLSSAGGNVSRNLNSWYNRFMDDVRFHEALLADDSGPDDGTDGIGPGHFSVC